MQPAHGQECPWAGVKLELILLPRPFAAAKVDFEHYFDNVGILATIRKLVVNSSNCNHGRSQATAL